MRFKRHGLAIINRSFWPKNQIIGESLMRLGEKANNKGQGVVIITQHVGNLKKTAEKFSRGSGLLFRSCKLRSDSSTKLLFRIVDATVFMSWVFWNLLLTRPKKIYVSTDPPLIVPFIVFIYSKIFKTSYVYHLQDIHPEATNIVVKLNPILFSFLKKIDGMVMRRASSIITITQTMKDEIIARSNTKAHVYLIDNPTASFDNTTQLKIKGFIFSGNLGRLQRIPLLLKSIDKYKTKGGTLPFLFIGGGVYTSEIHALSKKYTDITYGGLVDAKKANELTSEYEWSLLPIDDEVTKYAFPSKTSSYVSCGVKILSICSDQTSVAKWVLNNSYGVNSQPNINDLVSIFFDIENGLTVNNKIADRNCFSIEYFVQNISNVVFDAEEIVG